MFAVLVLHFLSFILLLFGYLVRELRAMIVIKIRKCLKLLQNFIKKYHHLGTNPPSLLWQYQSTVTLNYCTILQISNQLNNPHVSNIKTPSRILFLPLFSKFQTTKLPSNILIHPMFLNAHKNEGVLALIHGYGHRVCFCVPNYAIGGAIKFVFNTLQVLIWCRLYDVTNSAASLQVIHQIDCKYWQFFWILSSCWFYFGINKIKLDSITCNYHPFTIELF